MGNACSIIIQSKMNENIQKSSKVILTRYLYLKDEVKLALIVSLLTKNPVSIFWAYELYYSGFELELFELIWQIYFDFYATLNFSFKDYLIKKQKDWLKEDRLKEDRLKENRLKEDRLKEDRLKEEEQIKVEEIIVDIEVEDDDDELMNREKTEDKDKIISTIINDLLIRPYNLDVFMLKQTANIFAKTDSTTAADDSIDQFVSYLEINDYVNIADYILRKCSASNLPILLNIALDHFKGISIKMKLACATIQKKWKLLTKEVKSVSNRTTLLSIILYYCAQQKGLKMGKNLYMNVEKGEIEKYNNIYIDTPEKIYAHKILPMACIASIDEGNFLSLFKLERNTEELSPSLNEIYWYNWLYYASFSPIWLKRIQAFKGILDHTNKKVDFPDIYLEDQFYTRFNYEPDEQKKQVQDKSIQNIESIRTWTNFYNDFKQNSLYEPRSEILEIMTACRVKY
jgi:hypothetical protein